MDVAFTVPTSLLWVLGIAGALMLLILAALGVLFLKVARDFTRAWSRTWGW